MIPFLPPIFVLSFFLLSLFLSPSSPSPLRALLSPPRGSAGSESHLRGLPLVRGGSSYRLPGFKSIGSKSTGSKSTGSKSTSATKVSATKAAPPRSSIKSSRNRPPPALSASARWTSLLSGGFAGTVASTITCPLEVVKTQLQSSGGVGVDGNAVAREGVRDVVSNIWRREGVRGFWRGLPPTLLGIIPSRATYFWAYSTSREFLLPKVGGGTANAVLSGAAAGLTANTITNPIWMVKTRMQLLPGKDQVVYGGYADAVKTIYKTAMGALTQA